MTRFRHLPTAAAALVVAAVPMAATAGRGTNDAPQNTAPPVITGNATVGQTLSASAGTWSGKGLKFAFDWLRCDALGGSCVDTGSTSSSYTAAAADAGHAIRVSVTATNKSGSATAQSAPTAAVATPAAPAPTPDTTAPTAPTGLTSTATAVSLTLAWTGSTDNVGVAGYRVYQAGALVGTTTTTSYALGSLLCATSYSVAVAAFDAAGNVSAQAPLAASTAACPVSADPSGVPMPTGDLPGWHQIFTDDFTQDVPLGSFPSAVKGKWNPYPYPWKDTSKNGTYWPEKGISQHDGMMDLWLHTEVVNGVTYHISEAPQPILPIATRGQLYGRYVIRFRSDPVPGYKTAWLLWPDSGLSTDGEIDFPEGNLNDTIHAYMHHQGATSGSDQDAYATGVTYTSWHTAVIEWLPTRCTFILDGNVIGNSTTRIPDTPMHWVIQTETQLSGGAPADSASGHVDIDWVAVYAPA